MKVRKRKLPMWSACAIGVLISVITMLVFSFISALLVLNEHLDITHISVIRIAILYGTTLLGILIAERAHGEKKVVNIISGSVIAILQTAITLIFFKGATGGLLLNWLLITLAIVTSLLIFKKHKTPRRKRSKAAV